MTKLNFTYKDCMNLTNLEKLLFIKEFIKEQELKQKEFNEQKDKGIK